MTSWHSYPKVWNFGHAAVKEILDDNLVIEEKIDGSQFSFGVFDGELKFRSKGTQFIPGAPEKMFLKAIETVTAIKDNLMPGWTYRAEYLMRPKHNVLSYERHPNNYLIVFDVNTGEEQYLGPEDKATECARIGLECVPVLHRGPLTTQIMEGLLETISILGGKKIEGVVVKNYTKFGPDKKVLMAKHVSEVFKETHKKEWKVANPRQGDVIQALVHNFRSEARWQKSVQRLKESGLITDAPEDIGPLIQDVRSDTLAECKQEICDQLWEWAWPQVQRQLSHGLPEWYKKQLLEKFMGDSCA